MDKYLIGKGKIVNERFLKSNSEAQIVEFLDKNSQLVKDIVRTVSDKTGVPVEIEGND